MEEGLWDGLIVDPCVEAWKDYFKTLSWIFIQVVTKDGW